MVRLASPSVLPSTYDNFLYAHVGESTNGAPLTVLSVLARQNVDPWEEAADLSRLPPGTAAQRLSAMITGSPVESSNQAAVAVRLIALLPRHISCAESAVAAVPSEAAVPGRPPRQDLLVIAICIGLIVLILWIGASVFEESPIDGGSSNPSRLGEALSSTPGNEIDYLNTFTYPSPSTA